VAHCARVALSTLRSSMSASAGSFYRGQSLQEHKEACTKFDFGLPAKLVTADDRILQCCLYVHGLVKAAAASPASLVLLTNDNGLAVKAKVRRVVVVVVVAVLLLVQPSAGCSSSSGRQAVPLWPGQQLRRRSWGAGRAGSFNGHAGRACAWQRLSQLDLPPPRRSAASRPASWRSWRRRRRSCSRSWRAC
jgi:hypothetical protein